MYDLPKNKVAYFTFGQDHLHRVGGRTYDKDIVVKIVAQDPRQVMFDTFGDTWAFQYDNEPPDMTLFREIKELPYYE